MNISQEELIHAEIEAMKNSITMLKIKDGNVINRILVHTNDIEQFKNLGYLDSRNYDHNPQIGHPLDKQEYRREVLKQLNSWEKFKIFFMNLFRKKNKYGIK